MNQSLNSSRRAGSLEPNGIGNDRAVGAGGADADAGAGSFAKLKSTEEDITVVHALVDCEGLLHVPVGKQIDRDIRRIATGLERVEIDEIRAGVGEIRSERDALGDSGG